ncbi:BspA family leucine-rich repeat surface protein [Mycoplasma mycoides]|uniref:Myrrcad domain-containing protein n=1 Tax=Mycoplasma mycoides subsp. capri TaxID=40477 RepID=A0AB38GFH8_MYCMC|nr:BspA family leucine-rich repeat surface protein [Mycoplasma mycoides]ADH21965.1 conserved hypothetical protein [synthetic Mycoplasma mycoides JCVI-syn1.0]ACU78842.1 conserved hypothetical protein [Mycoplasma mycoides subsp. capri str. GM12]ACU79674.1 conserved hypothetical protein [Mycoplasma mycoides subsp. capri str. GM12]SRX59182.1 Myrrcad domain-containing protein [Mycoplasma mycoides subsp. capri]SRX61870.1 Myrrcad domain-containing protein [Mycoplasma mycoides subsp. capri]
MKKLLTILTSCSAIFLVFASTTLVKNSNNKNIVINYNSKNISKEHTIQGDRLTEIGYKTENGQVRIKEIPHTVNVIAAQLPTEITSLKGAFQTRLNDITWTVDWDTSRITNMNSMFYNTTWFNNPAILKWDTSKVTDMGEMFAYSKGFNHDLSNWDVSNVTNMEQMFANSTTFNNGNKPLEWGPKLKKIKNMKKMFKDAKAFKQNLNSWLMKTEVNNNDFGLDQNYQPRWLEKTEAAKPVEESTPQPGQSGNTESLSNDSEDTPELITLPKSDSSVNESDSIDNINVTPPTKPEISTEEILSPKADEALENPHTDNNLNEITKDKQKDDSEKRNILEDNTYKIPSLESKPNTILKQSSPSAAVITGAVLGTFTVLGIGVGAGYYYRKNLKNFYLNSAEKTKNLYFKFKEKFSKTRSKK